MAAGAPQYQPMPKLDSVLIDSGGRITIPWYRFLISVYGKLFPPGVSIQTPITTFGNFLAQLVANLPAALPGALPAALPAAFAGLAGGAEQVQILGASPFVFHAPIVGVFTSFGAEVELARSGTFHQVSLTGGSFWLMKGDQLRLTWMNAGSPPSAIWWPSE